MAAGSGPPATADGAGPGPDRGRPGEPGAELATARPRPGARTLLGVLLAAAVAASLLAIDPAEAVPGRGGLRLIGELLASLVRPETSADFLLGTVPSAVALTLAYAVAGTSLALAVGLPGAVLVSGALTRRRLPRLLSVGASRAVFAVLRAPHELVWAVVLVAVLSPHPLAGIVAIGLPYGATIARVLGERLQDVPEGPLVALRSAGASPAQVLWYGRVPSALADMVGYSLYRFECAVRAAAVLSVVGLGGVGLHIETALDDLRFERLWPLLAALVVVIVAVDWVSARIRQRVVA